MLCFGMAVSYHRLALKSVPRAARLPITKRMAYPVEGCRPLGRFVSRLVQRQIRVQRVFSLSRLPDDELAGIDRPLVAAKSQ